MAAGSGLNEGKVERNFTSIESLWFSVQTWKLIFFQKHRRKSPALPPLPVVAGTVYVLNAVLNLVCTKVKRGCCIEVILGHVSKKLTRRDL